MQGAPPMKCFAFGLKFAGLFVSGVLFGWAAMDALRGEE